MTSQRHSQRPLNTVFTTAHNPGKGGSQRLSTHSLYTTYISAARLAAGADADLVPMPKGLSGGGTRGGAIPLSLASLARKGLNHGKQNYYFCGKVQILRDFSSVFLNYISGLPYTDTVRKAKSKSFPNSILINFRYFGSFHYSLCSTGPQPINYAANIHHTGRRKGIFSTNFCKFKAVQRECLFWPGQNTENKDKTSKLSHISPKDFRRSSIQFEALPS